VRFDLRVPNSRLEYWAGEYDRYYKDIESVRIGREVQESGALTPDQFLRLAAWKTPRSKSRCRRNSPEFIAEVVRHSLAAENPRFKIEVLRLLDGVDWATASVVLHFCDRERWPILDVRAFWSLGQSVPTPMTYTVWDAYSAATRTLAEQYEVSMRTLDRALWTYSKVNQGKLRRPGTARTKRR
jgi:hypothetical protein